MCRETSEFPMPACSNTELSAETMTRRSFGYGATNRIYCVGYTSRENSNHYQLIITTLVALTFWTYIWCTSHIKATDRWFLAALLTTLTRSRKSNLRRTANNPTSYRATNTFTPQILRRVQRNLTTISYKNETNKKGKPNDIKLLHCQPQLTFTKLLILRDNTNRNIIAKRHE